MEKDKEKTKGKGNSSETNSFTNRKIIWKRRNNAYGRYPKKRY